MTTKFKVGDRVKIVCRHSDVDDSQDIGKTGTITEVLMRDEVRVMRDDVGGYAPPFENRQLELITSEKSELQELVEQVNTGKAALRKIHEKYSGKVKYSHGYISHGYIDGIIGKNDLEGSDVDKNIEIIPEPEPQPYEYTTEDTRLDIEISADRKTIRIDKDEYDLISAKWSFEKLANENYTTHNIFSTMRGGVAVQGTKLLSWHDVDKLLRVFKELGV